MLDLSSPGELWFTAETMLNMLRSRVDSVITEARVKDAKIKDDLEKAAWERIGEDHPVSYNDLCNLISFITLNNLSHILSVKVRKS